MPVNVMDIGSSKIRLMVADRGVNDTFIVYSSVETDYDGYFEGEFVNPTGLPEVMKQTVRMAERDCKRTIEKIVVAVPFEFCTLICRNRKVTYDRRKTITTADMWKFYQGVNEYKDNLSLTFISAVPVFLTLDDGRSVDCAVGEKTSRISGDVTLIYAETSFIKLLNEVMRAAGILEVEYVSEPLIEGGYVVSREERERPVILIDSGFLTTSVFVMHGCGIRMLNSFSIGLGHIINDLSEGLELIYEEADGLKNQIILSLVGSKERNYEISRNGTAVRVPLGLTNEIVCYRLEMMAQAINKCLLLHYKENPNFPIYLTGGGICRIHGAKDHLAKCLGKNVQFAVPKTPIYDKPEYSSRLALLNYAALQKKEGGTLAKLFKK